MEKLIKIRPYKAGDEKELNDLFNKIFHKSRPLEKWKWMYCENPASKNIAEWVTVAEKDGKIVGHYASWAVDFKVGDRVVTAGEPIDTMIDPENKGGIELLINLIKEHAKNNHGIAAFTFGFPNKEIYEIGKRLLGYEDLGVMIQYFKRLSIREAVKSRFPGCPSFILQLAHKACRIFYSLTLSLQKMKGDNGRSIKRVHHFDERVDKLWELIRSRYGIMAVRNQRYLNWRYGKGPFTIFIAERMGTLEGYVVLKLEGDAVKSGLIMDCFALDEAIPALLQAALRFFIDHGADYVLCGIIREDPFMAHLKRSGFREHKGFPPIPIVYGPLSSEIDLNFLKNPANWHFAYGDKER
ncbi:MAG: GNAT family N-acetyltransferase [Candidatus Brocadia sp.]|nr:GNAT family N-acetyltransferase [Candidatus Brocadia sp.]